MKTYFPYFFLAWISLVACKTDHKNVYSIAGRAQGTTYHIKFIEGNSEASAIQQKVDSLLGAIDNSLSTYLDTSLISLFNRSESGLKVDSMFAEVYSASVEVNKLTKGAFDPTIAPVVNAWGFGFTDTSGIDSLHIDSLLNHTGMEKLSLEKGGFLKKEKRSVMLDFNAIAQGYSVDLIGELLGKNGIEDYLVELGGELKSSGDKNGAPWKVGIDKPVDNREGRPLHAVVQLKNQSLATSGNYRKFYVKDGRKYSHTIDPATGFPVRHSLLSASVISPSCMHADAYATAFMVVGTEKAKKIARENDLGVILIYAGDKGKIRTYVSENIKKQMVKK